ncbi:alpha-isopropylmalate synthase regulatory domain-containing protein [Streptomyces sp. NPDC079020]|uniref:alpha-isopropylmalate synthase regulatory domain-containing protein n=1 Tax=Streptomyces sp. NPDC079020 TaxID=3365722 RepID=UPI0037D88156
MQSATDDSGTEATPKDLWELFGATYLTPGRDGAVALASWTTDRTPDGEHRFVRTLRTDDHEVAGDHGGTGNGPVSAFTHAPAGAGIEVGILDFVQHPTGRGRGSPATAYVECLVGGQRRWGRARTPPC